MISISVCQYIVAVIYLCRLAMFRCYLTTRESFDLILVKMIIYIYQTRWKIKYTNESETIHIVTEKGPKSELDSELLMLLSSLLLKSCPFQSFTMVQDRLRALNAAVDYFAADAGNLALANGEISLLDRQVSRYQNKNLKVLAKRS